MRDNDFTNIHQMQEYYVERIFSIVNDIGASPIIWQDPLDFGVEVGDFI